jgi:pre-mRNA-processing factor 40
LKELVDNGKIKARTKWKNIYPTFADNERYINMLGNPGSNPLELFWDVVDGLDQKLDAKIAVVEDALKRRKGDDDDVRMENVEVAPGMTWEEFSRMVKAAAEEDQEVRKLEGRELKEIFDTVRAFLFLWFW